MLEFKGSDFLRQRIVLSLYSGRDIKISEIRQKEENVGLKGFEACLLRLVDTITNGTKIEIDETGTILYFKPGMIIGGEHNFECNLERSIGYYIEILICLAPFAKEMLYVNLTGISNDQKDPSVDFLKLTGLPILKQFLGTDEGLELKVVRRGAAPQGGGNVIFSCPCRHKLRPFLSIDQGKVKRIRGVSWATKVSPAIANRMIASSKELLLQFLPDVYIQTDHAKGKSSGNSPGFGLTLVAETTSGVFLCGEACANPGGSDREPSIPEDIGRQAATNLMNQIYKGGVVDPTVQSVCLLFMALGPQDVSKVLLGPLSPFTIQFVKHIRDFLQVIYKIEDPPPDELKTGASKFIFTCVGTGFRNLNKPIL